MQKYALDAAFAGGSALVPYVMPAINQGIKTGIQLAGESLGKLVNRPRRVSKSIARVNQEMRSGVIPHVSGVPASIGSRFQSVKPRFSTVGQSVVISHREPLTNVEMVSGNTVLHLGVVNPFNPYLFPWLATIAGSYDMFKITRLEFQYIPACATAQTGQLVLAWDPQASDYTPDYFDLPMMTSNTFSPWMPATLSVPPSLKKYMGEQANATGVAQDMYNHGSLYVGKLGSDTNLVGTVYVNYTVQLFQPQPTSGLAIVVQYSNVATGAKFASMTTIDGFSGRFIQGTSGGLIVPFGVWKAELYYAGGTLSDAVSSVGTMTATGTQVVTNSAATKGIHFMFLKSSGLSTDILNYVMTFSTLSQSQLRLTRVDPASAISAAIFV